MSLKNYVTFGNSGLRVSRLCLGTMTFGEDWGWGSSEKESETILTKYIEQGGNFIDTANMYTNGHSEKIIGDTVGRYSSKRDRLVIATKFSINVYPGDPNGGGANAKTINEACEQSLRRLQTDYIDLYWMHAWDPHTPIEETLHALEHLVISGKVRYIGFSDVPAWKAAQAQMIACFRGWSPLIALQIEYSLLERTVEVELIPMARELGLGVVPWSPLKNGILSGKYTRKNAGNMKEGRAAQMGLAATLGENEYKIIDELTRIAEVHNTSPAGIALAWVMSRPGVTSTIIGTRKVEQFDANLEALTINLSKEEIATLDKLSEPTPTFSSGLLERARAVQHGGTMINDISPVEWPLKFKADERY